MPLQLLFIVYLQSAASNDGVQWLMGLTSLLLLCVSATTLYLPSTQATVHPGPELETKEKVWTCQGTTEREVNFQGKEKEKKKQTASHITSPVHVFLKGFTFRVNNCTFSSMKQGDKTVNYCSGESERDCKTMNILYSAYCIQVIQKPGKAFYSLLHLYITKYIKIHASCSVIVMTEQFLDVTLSLIVKDLWGALFGRLVCLKKQWPSIAVNH